MVDNWTYRDIIQTLMTTERIETKYKQLTTGRIETNTNRDYDGAYRDNIQAMMTTGHIETNTNIDDDWTYRDKIQTSMTTGRIETKYKHR